MNEITEIILGKIDQALESNQPPRRTYVGGSSIGGECERRIWFNYKGYGETIPAKLVRIFDIGHYLEPLIVKWLEEVFIVTGSQLEWSYDHEDGTFSGHLDGVIEGTKSGIEIPGITFPCLLEIKTANRANFSACVRNGIANAKPVYASQMTVYQAMCKPERLKLFKRPALMVMLCKDGSITMRDKSTHPDLYFEAVNYDQDLFERMVDRAERIIEAKTEHELARPCDESSGYPCSFCEFIGRCYG